MPQNRIQENAQKRKHLTVDYLKWVILFDGVGCYRLHDNTKSSGIKELDGRNIRLFGTGTLIILRENGKFDVLENAE